MPLTAQRLGVRDRCSVDQNVSGGVRYLAWLMQQFHNDLRLVAAAYYAGEDVVRRRDLAYRNPDVIAYVAKIFPHGSVLSSSPYTNSFSPVSITLFPTPANLLAASISTTS